MITSKRFPYAVNRNGKDKNWDFEILNTKFQDREGDLQDLIRDLTSGFAICIGLLGGQRRSKANAKGSALIMLDIDNSMPLLGPDGKPAKGADGKEVVLYKEELTFKQALEHPFIKKHCCLIYTSFSHGEVPGWDKFRLVFLLPEFVEGAELVEELIKLLMEQLPHDPSCKDGARVFYGNSKAEIYVPNPENELPGDWIRIAQTRLEQARRVDEQQQRELEQRRAQARQKRNSGEKLSLSDWGVTLSEVLETDVFPVIQSNPGLLFGDLGQWKGADKNCWCPLCTTKEKAPSFNVSSKKPVWICYGCSPDGGNYLSYARQRYGYGFVEAAKYLAEIAGCQLPELPTNKRGDRAKQITREEWQRRQERWELLKQIERLHGRHARRYYRQFGKLPVAIEAQEKFGQKPEELKLTAENCSAIVLYNHNQNGKWDLEVTPENIPTPERWVELGRPFLVFDADLETDKRARKTVIKQMIRLGYEVVLMADIVGSGKSTDVGAFLLEWGEAVLELAAEAKYANWDSNWDTAEVVAIQNLTIGKYQISAGQVGEVREVIHDGEFYGVTFNPDVDGGFPLVPIHHEVLTKSFRPNIPADGTPQKRAYYSTHDYRNSSTPELEAIPEAVSAAALVTDPDKLTQLGKEYRRRANTGETPTIEALCPRDHIVQAFRAKGTNTWRGADSPLCKTCPLFDNCEYLARQVAQKSEPVLRTHISKVSIEEDEEVIVFVDEAGRIEATQMLETDIETIDREYEELQSQAPELALQIAAIVKRIKQGLVRGQLEKGKFGLTHVETLEFLPTHQELQDLVFEAYRNAWHHTDDVWKIPSPYELAGRIKGLLTPNLKQEFENRSPEEISQLIEYGLTIGLLPRLIKIICGRSRGDVTISPSGKVVLTYRNHKTANALSKAKNVFLMDATPDLIDLSRKVGVHSTQIVQIKSKPPSFANQTINFVKGLGRIGAQREHFKDGKLVESEYSQQNRINHAISAIAAKYPGAEIGIIDRKAYIKQYQDLEGLQGVKLVFGNQFSENRNSNRFKRCKVIIIVDRPVENIGAKISEWHVMTGEAIRNAEEAKNHKGFQAWIRRKTIDEVIQGNARPRAQHRPDEPVDTWLLSEFSESEKQEIVGYFPDIQAKDVDAYDLSAQAAPKGVQTQRAILERLWEGVVAGEKLTIDQVAEAAGVKKARASQIVNGIHPKGYRGLRESLVLLSDTLNSRTKLLDLTPEDWWFAKTYLPQLAAELSPGDSESTRAALEDFVSIRAAVGDAKFRQILAATSVEAIFKLLNGFLRVTPEWFQAELLKARERCLQEVAIA